MCFIVDRPTGYGGWLDVWILAYLCLLGSTTTPWHRIANKGVIQRQHRHGHWPAGAGKGAYNVSWTWTCAFLTLSLLHFQNPVPLRSRYASLNPGVYVLIAGTYMAGMEGAVSISVSSNYNARIEQIWPPVWEPDKEPETLETFSKTVMT